MRSELEAREDILNLQNELETIISNGEAESRELVETETNRMAEIRSQIENLQKELEEIEKENRKIINQKNQPKMENKNVQFCRV